MTELVTTIADSSYHFAILERLSFRQWVYQDLDVKSIGFNSQVMTCHLSHLRFPCTSWTSGSPKRCRPWAICSAALRFMPRGHRFLWWNSKNKKTFFFFEKSQKMTFVFFPGKNDYKETVWEMICFFLRHWMIGHHTWPSWKPGATRSGHWWGRKRPPRGAVFSWELMPRLAHFLSLTLVVKKNAFLQVWWCLFLMFFDMFDSFS